MFYLGNNAGLSFTIYRFLSDNNWSEDSKVVAAQFMDLYTFKKGDINISLEQHLHLYDRNKTFEEIVIFDDLWD